MRLVSYNIEMGGAETQTGAQDYADALKNLDPDIVFFQESWYRTPTEDEITNVGGEIASLIGHEYYHQAIEPYGVSISTRLPVILAFDKTKLCGLVVEYKGTSVQLFNIHMVDWPAYHYTLRGYEYYDSPKILDPVEAAKLSLLDKIADLNSIFEVMDPALPTVIGGDFNEPSHLDWTPENTNFPCAVEWGATKTLENKGFMDVARHFYPDPVAHPLWSHNLVRKCGPWPPSRIDHLYINNGLKPVSFTMHNWSFSDHLPLEIVLGTK